MYEDGRHIDIGSYSVANYITENEILQNYLSKNSIYRGKNLGYNVDMEELTAPLLLAETSNPTIDIDLFLSDYWSTSNWWFTVAGFDISRCKSNGDSRIWRGLWVIITARYNDHNSRYYSLAPTDDELSTGFYGSYAYSKIPSHTESIKSDLGEAYVWDTVFNISNAYDVEQNLVNSKT